MFFRFPVIVSAQKSCKAKRKWRLSPSITHTPTKKNHMSVPCSQYRQDGNGVFTCPGSATCPHARRAIWGDAADMTFTADSAPCRAAVFAGVISSAEAGGTYRLTPSPGRDIYTGGSRHGVTVSSWQRGFPLSFVVSNAGSAAAAAAPAPAPAAMVSPSFSTATTAGVQPCSEYRTDSCSGTYRCPGAMSCPRANRAVWGTREGSSDGGTAMIFTGDSHICGAARAAAVISTEGGTFTLTPVGSRASLNGFTENGVTARPWNSYSACFTLACPGGGGSSRQSKPSASSTEQPQPQQQLQRLSKTQSRSAAISKKPKLFFAFENDPIIG